MWVEFPGKQLSKRVARGGWLQLGRTHGLATCRSKVRATGLGKGRCWDVQHSQWRSHVTLQCALRGWPFRETPINEWDVGLFILLWISLRIQVEMQPPSGQAIPQRCLAHSNIRHTWKSYVFKFSPKNLQPNVDSKCNQMLSLLNSVKYSLKFVYLLGKEIDNKI